MTLRIAIAGLALLVVTRAAEPTHAQVPENPFPRLMGMNIGAKDYHDAMYQTDLARLDVVIVGFYRGWRQEIYGDNAIRETVREIKARNPKVLLGQYTILNEARDDSRDTASLDIREKLTWHGWWLRNAAGAKVQWTSQYKAWEVNFTEWTKPDANDKRYPQWRSERDYGLFFQPVPEFEIWYLDNVMRRPRVKADWDGDGVDDSPDDPRIVSAWRRGYRAHWEHIRALVPNVILMGNTDGDLSEPEFRGQLEAAFLEGLMGKSWSIEAHGGWLAMMRHYRTVKSNLRSPALVGFNVWGDARNFRFFRYAYTSCLMDDGYFSFTDERVGYSSVPWFDEYDVKLGRAVTPPPPQPWQAGVYRRDFEYGVVLTNPGRSAAQVTLEPGFQRFFGKQDALVNNGEAVERLSIPSKDGIVLLTTKRTSPAH